MEFGFRFIQKQNTARVKLPVSTTEEKVCNSEIPSLKPFSGGFPGPGNIAQSCFSVRFQPSFLEIGLLDKFRDS